MAMNYPYQTSQSAYTTPIRSSLKEKGISDERITYSPNQGVLVDNKAFIRPERNYAGSTYTSPSNFQSAWDTYSKSLNQPQTGVGATGGAQPGAWNMPFDPQARAAGTTIEGFAKTGPTGAMGTGVLIPTAGITTPTTGAVPMNEQINKIIQGLQNYGQNQPAFDPYSSAAYQAAQAQTARQTQQGIRQAQEAFGSAGFGRSTGLGERAQRIGQEGTEYLMTQVLPQIQAQEQSRRQQEFQNVLASLQPLLGQQSRADELAQREIANRMQLGQITGNLPISPEAQGYIDQLLTTKRQAETAGEGGATAETMGQFRSQGDVLRNQLASLGYDISGLGAETSAADVRIPRGVQTQAARQFEQGTQERQQEFAYKQARDKIADEQYQQKFDEDVRRFGIEFAADEAVKNRQLSQADARIALEQAQESRLGQGAGKTPTTAPKNASASQFNDIYNTLLPRYGVANYDKAGKVSYTPSQNEDIQSRAVLDILNYNLSDDDTLKLLNKFGITEERARQLLGG